jgi:ribonuclease HI
MKTSLKTRTHYLSSVLHKSLNILRDFPQDLPVHQRAQNIDLIIDTHTPWAFFDGASQGVPPRGGARGGIFLTQNHTLSFKASTGPSTNNQSELSTLKLALLLAKEKWLTHLQIMGDSQIVIKWMDGKVKLGNFLLQPLFKDVKHLQSTFSRITFAHVYKENKMEVDRISKDGLNLQEGIWEIESQQEHISTYLQES